MSHFTSPGFGIYDIEEEDNMKSLTAIGSLRSPSKNLGDGYWCPYCYHEKGVYTWILYRLCRYCGMRSHPNHPEVKELMERR